MRLRSTSAINLAIFGTLLPMSVGAGFAQPLDYQQRIRPILADHCFACHGPDEKTRKAKLRLDVAEDAFAKKAWIPGKPAESEGIKRLSCTDPEEVMPPPKFQRQLTSEQKSLLSQWVAEGANYAKHWAFTPPQPAAVPAEQNPIDFFVERDLAAKKLSLAAPADKETWLRRVSFDLTGLPPSLEELDAYLADTSAEADAKVVDRLIASKQFGERLATDWLDAARYADSYGRHEDAEMMVWPYRDWVIRAFNDNMPYDQFLTWQTAGDLLPNPTQDMYIATAFNRLVNQSNEAGSNEEEFRQEIIADRVKTNATAILGLTMECAKCHDHKFDPISTKDYYSFAAFLNNIEELGLYPESTAGVPAPSRYLYKDAEEKTHEQLKVAIASAEKALLAVAESGKGRWQAWQKASGTPGMAKPSDTLSFEKHEKSKNKESRLSKKDLVNSAVPGLVHAGKRIPEFVPGVNGQGVKLDGDNFIQLKGRGEFRRADTFSASFWFFAPEAQDRAVLFHRSRVGVEAAYRGYEVVINNGMHLEFSLSHVAPGNSIRISSDFKLSAGKWNHVAVSYDGSSKAGGMKMYINGVLNNATVLQDDLYKDINSRAEWGDFDAEKVQGNSVEVEMTLGNRVQDKGGNGWLFDELNVFPVILTAPEVTKLHCGEFPDTPEAAYARYLRDVDADYQAAAKTLHTARTAEDDYVAKLPELMIMREKRKPRETFIALRGQFDTLGAKVTAETPASIWTMPDEFPKNRLGLAKWYVDKRNPLTARVAVNRLWQMFFGKGIVATSEDFGIQGSLPTHRELLDFLACEFRDRGWNVKQACRQIALSKTYRQASVAAEPRLMKDDPENLLLARGPSYRLPAEMLRDAALAAAGILNPEMGGKPVKPYQPDRLYQDGGVQLHYTQDTGDMIWKRSVYLFRKRTMPLPFLTNFDASTREYCRVRRETTSSPLQALNLLNAPDFVEPCRVLAEKMLAKHTPANVSAAVSDAYRRLLSRQPTAAELAVLLQAYAEQLVFYKANQPQAEALVRTVGDYTRVPGLPVAEVAALTMVNRLLFSDHESVVKH